MKLEQIKKDFLIFNTFRSTGIIVPILFMYLNKQLGLSLEQILMVAGIYSLLPFFLEIPLGYLGDRFGEKVVLMLGLIFQILSCISLIFLTNSSGYHIYLISIYVAGAAFSGADITLINSHIKDKEEFRDYMVDINGRLYKYTTFFILLGAVCYQFSPASTMWLQIACFIIALIHIAKIPEVKRRASFETQKKELLHGVKFIFSDYTYLSILLMSSIFAAAILINHKTIQFSFTDSLEKRFAFDSYWALGAFYIVGNLFSYNGTKFYKKLQLNKLSFSKQNLIFIFLLALSYILFSFNSLITVLGGFFILNIFKSIHRPVLNSELSTLVPFTSFKTTILSLGSLIAAIVSSLLHIAFAKLYTDPFHGNLYFIACITPLLFLCLYISYRDFDWSIFLFAKALTGKRSYLKKIKGNLYYVQAYPEVVVEDGHFDNLNAILASTHLPHAVVESKNNELVTSYLGSSSLKDVSYDEQVKYSKWIVAQYVNSESKNELGINSVTASIIDDLNLDPGIKSKLKQEKYWAIVHGDLHPENIMIFNDKVYFIDWDLAGEGWVWYDLLNLLTSPHLKISMAERSEQMQFFLNEFDKDEVESLIRSFLEFKVEQFKEFVQVDKSMVGLLKSYESLYAN